MILFCHAAKKQTGLDPTHYWVNALKSKFICFNQHNIILGFVFLLDLTVNAAPDMDDEVQNQLVFSYWFLLCEERVNKIKIPLLLC